MDKKNPMGGIKLRKNCTYSYWSRLKTEIRTLEPGQHSEMKQKVGLAIEKFNINSFIKWLLFFTQNNNICHSVSKAVSF